MRSLKLLKLLRGGQRAAIEGVMALVKGPVSVIDTTGRVLIGPDPEDHQSSYPIQVEGEALGEVRSGPGGKAIAELLSHLGVREIEKRLLADETLGRYKELTLLYSLGDRFSRMLDVDDVARTVVEEAASAVGASGATLLLHDRRRNVLRAVAAVGLGAEAAAVLPALVGVEGRVLRTGQAEFVEEVDTELRGTIDQDIRSMICAPMRGGERVFGVLRVVHTRPAAWNSGDLKLVTSLAAQAAAAVSGAQLHRNEMRELALRHHLERHVSPHLIAASLRGHDRSAVRRVALLICDLREDDRAAQPSEVIARMEERLVLAIDALLRHGGVVDIPKREMVVGAFADGDVAAGDRAVGAAKELLDVLSDSSGTGHTAPGIGICAIELDRMQGHEVGEALNAAALLQAASEGRILVDQAVHESLSNKLASSDAGEFELPGGRTQVYEVRV